MLLEAGGEDVVAKEIRIRCAEGPESKTTPNVVEVDGGTVEAFANIVNHFNEPSWRPAVGWRHAKPLNEACGRANAVRGYGVLVDLLW